MCGHSAVFRAVMAANCVLVAGYEDPIEKEAPEESRHHR